MIDWQTFFGLWKPQEITGNVFGTLVDVSGSMGQITGGQINVHGGKWAKSIFQVIDDLIKNDISSENKVFALAFGANRDKGTFDILSTLEKVQDYVATIDEMKKYSKQKIVEEILQKLEENGAKHIRKWADIQTIYNAIGIDDACTLLHELRQSNYVCRDIVDNCLPSNCKDWGNNDSIVSNLFESMFTSAVTTFRQASPEEVRAAMEKAKVRVKSEFELIEQLRTFSIHNARKIVHGVKGNTEMTDQRANELLKRIEPFIYGGTSLYGSLKDAASLFSRCVISTKYSKILVVVSDGEPSDYGNALEFAKQFEDLKTTVVSCFITNTEDIEPRRLYSSKQHEWSDGANLLFDLCSPIPSQMVPRTILLKQNWDIDIEDNETKLFLQVNDPENVHDICDLAYNAVCSHDSLAELLVSASLDISIYMNASPTRMTPADQRSEPVCYAIASSATIHLAMKRILGRHDGYPEFSDLYKEMVARHGPNPTNTFQVLIETCPYYRLRCDDDIGVFGALEAIRERRPVVAIFKLTNTEWKSFRRFFKENPKEILRKSYLDITNRSQHEQLSGHAVVLTSFTSKGLTFMNSWGTEWANKGFFTIENADVLNCKFIDVYWEEDDLLESEREYYKQHGARVARDLMTKLIGLQSSTYTCEVCGISSKVTEFTGTLSEAVCPKCSKRFEVGSGNILALNMYLLALSSI